MEKNIAKQEFRISSLENQLKIQDIEIKDLKDKIVTFGPKIQDLEENVTSLKWIIMRIKPMKRRRNHYILEKREIVLGFKEVLIANFDVLKYIFML